MQSHMKSKNELFSGLTFSLSDIDIDRGLNLVPISLDLITDEVCNIDKECLDEVNTNVTDLLTELTTLNFNKYDISPPLSTEVSNLNIPQITNSGGIQSRYMLNRESQVTDAQSIHELTPCVEYVEAPTYHWFFLDGNKTWKPFSLVDSGRLEAKQLFLLENERTDEREDCVSVNGGRYDVYIRERIRRAVYWEEPDTRVRRVSWLYRDEEGRNHEPFDELECELLEAKYIDVLTQKLWHQWLPLTDLNDQNVVENHIVFHASQTISQYRRFYNEETLRARVVYRGLSSIYHLLEQGDYDHIDHVVMIVHGIGSVCDLRGRGLVDCVSDMRKTSIIMAKEHFPEHRGRVEYLPVCWHSLLHSHIDQHLSRVTLPSVPRLRTFTNSTLVDVLCYSSPAYCESILSSVAIEMNRIRHLFMSRYPYYDGPFSIVGHSLGAMIALDLISCNNSSSLPTTLKTPIIDITAIPPLDFDLGHIFALGSPISLFLTARGISFLDSDFNISTLKSFVNIFHPFDPVAYRMEPMLTNDYPSRPVVIPHHKGRKRLHLELKDNIAKVGSDIKSKLLKTLKITWSSLQEFASAHKISTDDNWEEEDVLRVIEKMDCNRRESDESVSATTETNVNIGSLNGCRRVDYVLQEAPLESFNDYLFALGSHACYWESEDTILMILNEIYATLNIPKLPSSYDLSDQFNTSSPLLLSINTNKETYFNNTIPNYPPTIQTYSPKIQNLPTLMTVSPSFQQTVPPFSQTSTSMTGFSLPIQTTSSVYVLPQLIPGLSTSMTVLPTPSAYPLPNYLKDSFQSNISPPLFPIIQNTSFFVPSCYEIESPASYNNVEPALTYSECKTPSVADLPPMSYKDMVQSPSLQTFPLNSNIAVYSNYYQSFLPPQSQVSNLQTMQYFQPPQINNPAEFSDIDTYFSNSSKNNDDIKVFRENTSSEYSQKTQTDNPTSSLNGRLTSEVNKSDNIEAVRNNEARTSNSNNIVYNQGACGEYSSEVRSCELIQEYSEANNRIYTEENTDIYCSYSQNQPIAEESTSNIILNTFGAIPPQIFETERNEELCFSNDDIVSKKSSSFNTSFVMINDDSDRMCDVRDDQKQQSHYLTSADDLGSHTPSQSWLNVHSYRTSKKDKGILLSFDNSVECHNETSDIGEIRRDCSGEDNSEKAIFKQSYGEDRTINKRDSEMKGCSSIKGSETIYSFDDSSRRRQEYSSSTLDNVSNSSSLIREVSDASFNRASSPKISSYNPRSSPMNVMSMSHVSGSRPLVPQSGKLFGKKKK